MINEHQKYPTNKTKYDNNYDRIFPKCPVCKGIGHTRGWDTTIERFIKRKCLYCNGRGGEG